MGTSSEKAVENVAIFAIKGTLPLPLGWSRPLVSRIIENGEREYTVAGQAKSSWQSTEPLDQYEEEGFLTRLGTEIGIASSDIPESWIFYIRENQLRELPATTALLKLVLDVCNHSTKLPPLTKTDHPNEVEASLARFARLSNSQLQDLRKRAFSVLFDEIVTCDAVSKDEINRLLQTSLMLIDLAETQAEGSKGISLALSLMFESDSAPQSQHWLKLVCTKFGFSSSIQEWNLRAQSMFVIRHSRAQKFGALRGGSIKVQLNMSDQAEGQSVLHNAIEANDENALRSKPRKRPPSTLGTRPRHASSRENQRYKSYAQSSNSRKSHQPDVPANEGATRDEQLRVLGKNPST
ncbi:MAG: hypothetical protein MUC43_18080 [Pirellula sp.]|jgi:hypothetical protein|nr:hypothetical protein [Pirellula sp.]